MFAGVWCFQKSTGFLRGEKNIFSYTEKGVFFCILPSNLGWICFWRLESRQNPHTGKCALQGGAAFPRQAGSRSKSVFGKSGKTPREGTRPTGNGPKSALL
jgi:hypothetical protein